MNGQEKNLAEILIAAFGVIVSSGLLGVLSLALKQALESWIGQQRLEQATRIAMHAIAAAEQLAKANGWDNADKLRAALDQARDLGAAHGIVFTDDQWRAFIESGVLAKNEALDPWLSLPAQSVPEGTTVTTSVTQPMPGAPVH